MSSDGSTEVSLTWIKDEVAIIMLTSCVNVNNPTSPEIMVDMLIAVAASM